MSRRRVEDALRAGKDIAKGRSLGDITEVHDYHVQPARYGVLSVQYSSDGNVVVIGYSDGTNEILSVDSGKLLRPVQCHKVFSFGTLSIRFKPHDPDVFYTVSTDGLVRACHVSDGSCVTIAKEDGNEIFCLDFDLRGDTFATSGKDRNVRLYDATSNKLLKLYAGYGLLSPEHTLVGHEKRVFALRFHPEDNCVFITGGWDNHLKVWDTRTEAGVVRSIPGPHLSGDALDIQGNLLLTGSWVQRDALQLWDYRQGALVKSIPLAHAAEGEYLYAARFLSAETLIAGGSGTNSAQLISLVTDKLLCVVAGVFQLVGEVALRYPVQAIDCGAAGGSFTVAGGGDTLKIAAIA